MSDIHQRKCRDCGNLAEHSDRVTPEVCCKKCGSQDTRAVKYERPQSVDLVSDGRNERPHPIKCIFCDFKATTLAELKDHSATCKEHPLYAYKVACDLWQVKTEWVQESEWEFPVLGYHRADVMRAEIERLRESVLVAREARDSAEQRAKEAVQAEVAELRGGRMQCDKCHQSGAGLVSIMNHKGEWCLLCLDCRIGIPSQQPQPSETVRVPCVAVRNKDGDYAIAGGCGPFFKKYAYDFQDFDGMAEDLIPLGTERVLAFYVDIPIPTVPIVRAVPVPAESEV